LTTLKTTLSTRLTQCSNNIPSGSDTVTKNLVERIAGQKELDIIEYEAEIKVQDAINGVQLRKWTDQGKKRDIIALIAYFIQRTFQNVNVKNNITAGQSAVLASDIVDLYPYESFLDLVLALKMYRRGEIGDGKDYKIDGQTVLHKILPAYFDLKAQHREKSYNVRKNTLNQLPKWNPSDVEKFEVGTTSGPKTKRGPGIGSRFKDYLGM